jgi:hypothetical protein
MERWHKLEDVLTICPPGMEKRKFAEASRIRSALSKHLEAIENRFSKVQIGLTEETLEAIEKEESEAAVARIFGRERSIRKKVG